jgi:hypothetical protein
LVDVLLVAWVAVKRSKEALVAYLESEESDEMFDNVFKRFWTRLNSASIKTGAKVVEKDEAGAILKETEELLTPLENITRELTRFIMLKFSAMEGGKKKALRTMVEQAAQDPNNPGASSLQGLLAMAASGRKGLDLEGLLTALVAKYLFKEGPNQGTGGSGGGTGW